MRKLKLQIQISVDGFIAGPNGEMDWMVWDWDDELKDYVTEITEPVDCILLGRKLAEGFIPHWEKVAANPNDPEYTAGIKYSSTSKVVFSKTLNQTEWKNTELAKGDLVEEISRLKQQNGKDIIAYGGGSFVSSLIRKGLIDEFQLFVNPIALGEGMAIFRELDNNQKLILEGSTTFSCGIVILKYEKATYQITKADRDACHALCRNGKARATLRRLSSTVLRTQISLKLFVKYACSKV